MRIIGLGIQAGTSALAQFVSFMAAFVVIAGHDRCT
jgi:hypothetical protein